MGQIKNIKLHIVTDIKLKNISNVKNVGMECTCRKVAMAAGIVGAVAYLSYNRLRNATENETETEVTMDSIVQNDKETLRCHDMNDEDTETIKWPAPVGDTEEPVYS